MAGGLRDAPVVLGADRLAGYVSVPILSGFHQSQPCEASLGLLASLIPILKWGDFRFRWVLLS
jgi:hypothetical protein